MSDTDASPPPVTALIFQSASLALDQAEPARMRQKSDSTWWERPDSGSAAALTAA